VEVDRGSG